MEKIILFLTVNVHVSYINVILKNNFKKTKKDNLWASDACRQSRTQYPKKIKEHTAT